MPRASPPADIGKTALLGEANLLRRLFRVYRSDREFLKADSRNRIVMFLDSHEITAYVDPDAPTSLEGFLLRFEALEGPALPKGLTGNNYFKVVVDWARWCSSTRGGMRCP